MGKTGEIVVGVVMLAVGTIYLLLVAEVPRRGAVDASFVPRALAILMLGLGAVQVIAGWRRAPAAAPAPRPDARAMAVVAVSLALIAAFIALLRPLGFPLAAALFLFAQFWLLTPTDRSVRPVAYVGIAVVASIVIFLLFRHGFGLLLPAGPLTRFLP